MLIVHTGTKVSIYYTLELGTMPSVWKSSRIGSTSLTKTVGWGASKSWAKKRVVASVYPLWSWFHVLTFILQVPKEFQTQVSTFANPPTLAMAVTDFIRRLKAHSSGPTDSDLGMGVGDGSAQVRMSDDARGASSLRDIHLEEQEVARKYLNSIYIPLRRHYEWFRRTQRGHVKIYGRTARSRTEAYRWRGRSETHVLTSGMDDFPRAPAHAGELHLDLISWMGFFSRTMKEIAEFIGKEDDAETFAENENAIVNNIDGNALRLDSVVPTLMILLDRFTLERGGPDVLRSRDRSRRSVISSTLSSLY